MSAPPMPMKSGPPPGVFGPPQNVPMSNYQPQASVPSGMTSMPPTQLQHPQQQHPQSHGQLPPLSNTYNGFSSPPSIGHSQAMNTVRSGPPRMSSGQSYNYASSQNVGSLGQYGPSDSGPRMLVPSSVSAPHPPMSSQPFVNGPSSMEPNSIAQYPKNSMGPPQNIVPFSSESKPTYPAAGHPSTTGSMRPPLPSQPLQNQQQHQQIPGYNMGPVNPNTSSAIGSMPPMTRTPRPPLPTSNMGGIGPPPTSSRPPLLSHATPPVPDAQYNNSPNPPAVSGQIPGSHMQGPPSQKSSRAPSPIASQSYDALEGQFTPSSGHPMSMPPQPSQTGAPPTTGRITGKRQYPQMPSQMQSPAHPASMSTSGMPPVYSGSPMHAPQQLQQTPQQMQQPPQQMQQPPQQLQQSIHPQQPQQYQPQQQQQSSQYSTSGGMAGITGGMSNLSTKDTISDVVDLIQQRKLIGPEGVETPINCLPYEFSKTNASPEIFRCTLNAVPQTSALLTKSRLPLGVIIHPFKDLTQLPVITSTVIVRCRSCRTYINPFISFVDRTRWKCNLCYRINDLPEEFSFDPVSRTYGDPQRRPEVRSSTIEFIAPSEYMLRPPQPAVYLFVLDVTYNAIETGYLTVVCKTLLAELEKLPGDSRTQIGFIAFDRAIHFFNLAEGLSQPQMLTVSDIDDIFLPLPDSLLVNLHESHDLVQDLLQQLPQLFANNMETGNALGATLEASYKLLSPTGGRITVFQTCLPSAGPGALQVREDISKSNKNIPNLGPATDFYKKLALDCSAQQVAIDLFMLNTQYADIATVACASKYSGGCVYHYPSFHTVRSPPMTDKFESDFARYLYRKIGFEAVMRIRCTRGLSIHTFHGNFFVRSTDLLSLPNINPDAGFGMQMSIEESLNESNTACFQAALLYTSSKGERRIRVHTLCLPVTTELSAVHAGADQQAIAALLAKMAVDRTLSSSLGDAQDALIIAAVDALSSYASSQSSASRIGNLLCPYSLRLLPLYVLSLLKSKAFRSSHVSLDERVCAMEQCKTLPMCYLLQKIYPNLYPVHNLDDEHVTDRGGNSVPWAPVLQLSAANLDRHGAYLLDVVDSMILFIGGAISDRFCQDVFDKPDFSSLCDGLTSLPERDNPTSERLHLFIYSLMDSRPYGCSFIILREDSKRKNLFFQHFVEDRTESTMSYYEFIQHIQKQAKG
ncbi:transport Sec24A-like isoform X1 [Octopus vulgaris]|nr:transport Sec24A-like isoform X1 [Octopus vulgaris]